MRTLRALRADAEQDTFLGLLVAPPPPEVAADSARLAAYRRGVFRRRFRDLLRREARHAHAALDAQPIAAADRAACQEIAERVHVVLARMREHGEGASADLLELRFLDGCSIAAIAKRFDKPPTSISAQFQRAKKKFLTAWLAGGGGIVAISAARPYSWKSCVTFHFMKRPILAAVLVVQRPTESE